MDRPVDGDMHIAIVSYQYDLDIGSPLELLKRYDTTVGWAEGLEEAGAHVSVILRFSADRTIERSEARYHFVHNPTFRMGSLVDRADRINQRIAALRPDAVHVDGLSFARQAARLRAHLPDAAIVLQDHANRPPRQSINRATLARSMRQIDGVVLCAKDLAEPWQKANIMPARMPLFEVPEGSSRFCPGDRSRARTITGLHGAPLLVWVGRLDTNKDPLTVLEAFGRVTETLPHARLAMVFHAGNLVEQVCEWKASHACGSHVCLLGQVGHASLESIYRSADLFVLGSHREGSGYSLIEALSCGITPVVTDIASFRKLAGDQFGFYWTPGDVAGCAEAILRAAGRTQIDGANVRARFEEELSFTAIGRKAMAVYGKLVDERRGRAA